MSAARELERIEARKVRKRAKRRFRGARAFDRELAMLAHGASVEDVLPELFGRDVHGLHWQALVGRVLTHGSIVDGEVRDEHVRRGEDDTRALLDWLVRTLNACKRSGSRIRATGPEVFQGRYREAAAAEDLESSDGDELEHDLAELLEHFDEETGELLDPRRSEQVRDTAAELAATLPRRPYCASNRANRFRAGGLSARVRRNPRTLCRYGRLWKRAGVLGGQQPPHGAEDAVSPRRGDWAYAQWWPALELPPETLRRLREAWGELKPRKVPPPSSAPTAAPRAAPSSATPPKAAAPPERPPPLNYAELIAGVDSVLSVLPLAAKGRPAKA